MLRISLFIVAVFGKVSGQQRNDESSETEKEGGWQPYSFAFTAGRFPGNVDRTRAEYGDDNGVIRGLYAYVDPAQNVRSVQYTADKDGFHPTLNMPAAEDTPAVAAAKARHLNLFDKIAKNRENYRPTDTKSVYRAKLNHAKLYEQIAAQHAKISADREAARSQLSQEEKRQIYSYDDGKGDDEKK